MDVRMLGTFDVTPDPEGLARQSKRAALLAYLLLARGFRRRDNVVAIFWPELDSAHARNALSQALHVLRHSLGEDAVITRGEDVGIDTALVRCDVHAFEDAMARGACEEALRLYRGPLLDGFYVPDSPDFEAMIEQERRRLREAAGSGAWSLASAHARDADAALRWYRIAVGSSVFDETQLRAVASTLVDAGHRAVALQLCEDFASRLARELDLEPSPETRAMMAAIREPATRPLAISTRSEPSAPDVVRDRGEPPARARRPRMWAWIAAIVAIAALPAGLIATRDRPADDDLPRLAIMPLRNTGPAEYGYFAEGIGEEIRNRVAQAGGLTVVTGQDVYRAPGRTQRGIGELLGARWVLDGSASWQPASQGGGRLRVRIDLTSTAEGVPPWGNVFESDVTDMTQLSTLYAAIAQRVMNELDVVLRTERVATSGGTSNLEAYDLYLQGRSHLKRSAIPMNQRAAISAFRRAIALDRNFASAYAYLAEAYTALHWTGGASVANLDTARTVLQQAVALAPALPETHTTFGHLLYVCCEDYPGALGHLERSLAQQPEDARLHMITGNVLKRRGAMADAIREYEAAARLDPMWRWPKDNLGHAQLWMRRYSESERTFRDVIAREPQNPFAHVHLALARVLHSGDVKGAQEILANALRVAEGLGPVRLGYDVAMMARDYRGALAALRAPEPPLTRSLLDEWLVSDRVRGGLARRWAGDALGARASFDSARIELSGAPRASRRDTLWLRSGLAIALAGLGDGRGARQEIAYVRSASPLQVDAIEGPKYLLHAALALVLLGDNEAASEILAELMRRPGPVSRPWLHALPFWDSLRADGSLAKVGAGRRF